MRACKAALAHKKGDAHDRDAAFVWSGVNRVYMLSGLKL